MRRLLYCLAGSTLLHGVLLWAPFPMSAGGAGEHALQPVRVELMYAPRSEAPKRVSRRPARPKAAALARAARTRPNPRQTQAPARSEVQAVKAAPAKPERVGPTPARTQSAVKMRPKPPRPEPFRSPEPTVAAKPAEDARPAKTAASARKPASNTGSNDGVVTKEHLTHSLAVKTTADGGLGPGTGFSPARYARTVPPRYPGKARRAGWEGTTVLKVRVDAMGVPDRVMVDQKSGFAILDDAAVRAVKRWQFHPARRGLNAVESWVRVPVAFQLKEDRR